MIRHIVLMKIAESVDSESIDLMFTALADLQKKIPEILHFHWGINNSPENLEQGFRHGFMMDFQDARTREIYLNHPTHIAVAQEKVHPLLEDGLTSVIVFDILISSDF